MELYWKTHSCYFGPKSNFKFQDASIRLFDLKSTEVITALQVKLNELVSMAVSPCQTYLIVGSSNACLATIILKEQTLKVVLQRKADDLIDSDHPIEAVDIYRTGFHNIQNFIFLKDPNTALFRRIVLIKGHLA